MIIVRFKDEAAERRGLERLLGEHFSFKSWDTGETAAPERALAATALESIPFEVVGPATYERLMPLRSLSADAV